jgi:two-component system, LytTR family, response regulator
MSKHTAVILQYLIVEDAPDVCKGIRMRMQEFTDWHCLAESLEITETIAHIKTNLPQLIFMDWNIRGGSTYEVLALINTLKNYHPYIVYFTGFQNDEPEIPQQVFNLHKVDKYFIKPIWEKLSEQLPDIIQQATARSVQSNPYVFDIFKGGFKPVMLTDIAMISIYDTAQRTKIIYTNNDSPIVVKLSFDEIDVILQSANINYFAPNKRENRVIKGAIAKFERPYIYFTNEAIPKVPLGIDSFKEYEEWIKF